jgi:CheY-like chemotaxis protein
MNAAFDSPILLVTADAAFVTRVLRELTQARILNVVDVVEDEASALAYLAKRRPAVVLLDDRQPALPARIRREEALGDLPILVVDFPLDASRLLAALREPGVERLLRS